MSLLKAHFCFIKHGGDILIGELELTNTFFVSLILFITLVDIIAWKICEYIDDKNQMKKENLKNNLL